MPILAASICFFALHGGPADHFATYGQALKEEGHTVYYCAEGPAYNTLEKQGIQVDFSVVENEGPDEVAETFIGLCQESGSMVITDIGHPFSAKLHRALKKKKPELTHIGYYDNPEPFVPGGYSEVAAQVCKYADWILFASKALTKTPIYQRPNSSIDLPFSKRRATGYYPINRGLTIKQQRQNQGASARKKLFKHLQRADQKEHVLVYAGGNNEIYFEKALPAFLSMLCESLDQGCDLSDTIVVFQQHPGAKKENRDVELICKKLQGLEPAITWTISPFSTDVALNFADSVWYYQTSMSPLFALAGIPAVQVGHETYQDLLVRNQLCALAFDSVSFLNALTEVKGEGSAHKSGAIHEALGIDPDPIGALKKALGIF